MDVTNAGRTINGVPRHAREHAADPVLRVSGCCDGLAEIRQAQLDALPRVNTREFLTLDERACTPDYDLGGVLLTDLLGLVRPRPDARYVTFAAGPYTHPVTLADIDRVILCDRLDGQPIPVERGGPWRVLIPAHSYNMGVKWLDRIALSSDEPDDSATRLAEARERARQFKRNQAAGTP